MASLLQWTWVWVNSGSWWWMDREAWRAVVHGVAKSRTRLSNWTVNVNSAEVRKPALIANLALSKQSVRKTRFKNKQMLYKGFTKGFINWSYPLMWESWIKLNQQQSQRHTSNVKNPDTYTNKTWILVRNKHDNIVIFIHSIGYSSISQVILHY